MLEWVRFQTNSREVEAENETGSPTAMKRFQTNSREVEAVGLTVSLREPRSFRRTLVRLKRAVVVSVTHAPTPFQTNSREVEALFGSEHPPGDRFQTNSREVEATRSNGAANTRGVSDELS